MYDCDLNLNDLLADPLVRLVMKSDGVDEGQIRRLAGRIAPHQEATRALLNRQGEMSPPLRHMPSCRGWRSTPPIQPSA